MLQFGLFILPSQVSWECNLASTHTRNMTRNTRKHIRRERVCAGRVYMFSSLLHGFVKSFVRLLMGSWTIRSLKKSRDNHYTNCLFMPSGLGATFHWFLQASFNRHKDRNNIPDRFGYRPPQSYFRKHIKTSIFMFLGISKRCNSASTHLILSSTLSAHVLSC